MSLQHAIHHHQLQQQLAKKQDRQSFGAFCQTSFLFFFHSWLIWLVLSVWISWNYVGELTTFLAVWKENWYQIEASVSFLPNHPTISQNLFRWLLHRSDGLRHLHHPGWIWEALPSSCQGGTLNGLNIQNLMWPDLPCHICGRSKRLNWTCPWCQWSDGPTQAWRFEGERLRFTRACRGKCTRRAPRQEIELCVLCCFTLFLCRFFLIILKSSWIIVLHLCYRSCLCCCFVLLNMLVS